MQGSNSRRPASTARNRPKRYFAGRVPRAPDIPVPPAPAAKDDIPASRPRSTTAAVPQADANSTRKVAKRVRAKPVVLVSAEEAARAREEPAPALVRDGASVPEKPADGGLRMDEDKEGPVEEEDEERRGGDWGEESEGSGESESGESSEDEDEYAEYGALSLPAPVFVPRAARAMASQIEAAEEARGEAQEREAALQANRVQETRKMVAQTVAADERRAAAGVAFDQELPDMPDDRDGGSDEDVQYALWEVRELKRIKRDREAAAKREDGVD